MNKYIIRSQEIDFNKNELTKITNPVINEMTDEMIKIFQEKYHFEKYIEVINLADNYDFKKFLNMMILYYNEHPMPKLNIKSKKFNKMGNLEVEAVDKVYIKNEKYPFNNYMVINYIFYILYIMIKNLDSGFDSIDNMYKKKLKGDQLNEALFFNKTDKYNALSSYAHILLYMIFYNTSFMPKYMQEYFKDLFKINKKGDKLIKECNDTLINSKDKNLFVCNYPDKPLNIASSQGIIKLFQIIADNMLVSESLELSKSFTSS
jgi:hypothetical protein